VAVTLIATVGGADSNSLVSLEYADAYFENQLHFDEWDAISDTDKKKRALITATSQFTELDWWGVPASDEQALPFPRIYRGVSDGQSNPKQILHACCEHALVLATTGGNEAGKRARLRAQGVLSYRIGDASETLAPLSTKTGTEEELAPYSGRVRRLLSSWVRSGWATDSGRRPQSFLWWPPELTS